MSRSGGKALEERGRPSWMLGMPFWMCGSGREALPDMQECLEGPSGCPGVVGRPSWMSGSGRVALPDVRKL